MSTTLPRTLFHYPREKLIRNFWNISFELYSNTRFNRKWMENYSLYCFQSESQSISSISRCERIFSSNSVYKKLASKKFKLFCIFSESGNLLPNRWTATAEFIFERFSWVNYSGTSPFPFLQKMVISIPFLPTIPDTKKLE